MSKFSAVIDNVPLEPIYRSESGAIYNTDCMKLLPYLGEITIDLTFTSPPYNIGKEYESVMSIDDYVDWCSSWIDMIYNVTKPTGSFWLNVGYMEVPDKGKCVPISYLLWNVSRFYLEQEIVWNYGAGVACKKRLSPRNEKILWYVKDKDSYTFNLDAIRDKNVKYPNQKKNGRLRCNPLGKNPTDVWQIAKVTSGKNRSSIERVDHPAQTPLELVDRIVKAGSNEGEIVLDPFMGSGTLAVSCINNKRFFIGSEINPRYCEIAIDRINSVMESI